MDVLKLGVIDSGIGGLTVVKDLIQNKLNLEIFYISDANNVPYGNKDQDFMYERLSFMTKELLKKKVQAIVIACNTATAKTIQKLREEFPIPFVGVEPYINFINHDENIDEHKYALILTEATSQSERFQKLKQRLDPHERIDVYPQKKLALLIEGLAHVEFANIEKEIEAEIFEINNKGYTHLILGCTHYPIIKRFLESKLKLETVDPTPHITHFIQERFGLTNNQMKEIPTSFHYNYDASKRWNIKHLSDFPFLFL